MAKSSFLPVLESAQSLTKQLPFIRCLSRALLLLSLAHGVSYIESATT